MQPNPLYAFNLASRCGAKTRIGSPCKSPAVRFKSRCRMHGGARGSGAAKGNQNAFKHGYNGREVRSLLLEIREFMNDCKQVEKIILNLK